MNIGGHFTQRFTHAILSQDTDLFMEILSDDEHSTYIYVHHHTHQNPQPAAQKAVAT